MALDPNFLKSFTRATEWAAFGAFNILEKNDKILADKGAVDMMRTELNKIDIDGRVVIGEGEMDEAPMLYIGEKVGTKNGQKVDIALDPLEGTNFVAKNLPNAFSIIAVAEKDNLFSAPDTYMEKIAVGSNLPKNIVDLDYSIEKNIKNLSDGLNKKPQDITVCILKRPRHQKIIDELKKLNVQIKFIEDGDVFGAILVADEKSPIDLYLGIGGGPEGVLAAAALSCLGGQIQTRLVLNEYEKIKAKKLGIKDFKRKYQIDDMIKGDVMFSATAITDGEIVDGIKVSKEHFTASSITLHKVKILQKKLKISIKNECISYRKKMGSKKF